MSRTPLEALKPRKSPRQARSVATIDAIHDATIQVLVAYGMRRLTTTRVAERAGVSVGTMYQYFPHKQALLYAVIQRYLDEVAALVEECCRQHAGQPIAVASDALVSAYILAKGKHAESAQALYLASAEVEVAELVNSTLKRFQDATVPLLIGAPDASFADPAGVAFALLAALTGATRVAFEHGAGPAKLEEFRRHMTVMSRGFLQRASNEAVALEQAS